MPASRKKFALTRWRVRCSLCGNLNVIQHALTVTHCTAVCDRTLHCISCFLMQVATTEWSNRAKANGILIPKARFLTSCSPIVTEQQARSAWSTAT